MDEPFRMQTSNEALKEAVKEAVKAANQLLDDADKTAIELRAAQTVGPRQVEKQTSSQISYPIAPDERLEFANKTAAQVSARFAELDSSDNKFLGRHELTAAAKHMPETQLLLNHYNDIIPLYYDHLNAYKSTISQDHLGISQGDLSGFKAVTSSNYDDLKSYARTQVIDTLPGRAGFLLGGVTAGTAVIAGAIGLLPMRSGLVGLGIGLGIMGAGGVIGYFSEKSQLDALRSKISTDSTLDSLIIKERQKQ